MNVAWLRDLAAGVLDLVFAPVCVACGQPVSTSAPERMVCPSCWAHCRALPSPRCERCWYPRRLTAEPSPVCQECEALPAALRVVRSAFVLGETPRRLVHALKYRGWTALAAVMAERMARLPLPLDVREEARVVVPVPVSAARLRERGYNQAALLADVLAARMRWRLVPDLLERARSVDSQTALHPAERRANVAGVFRARPGRSGALRGEHVILVDDVWTTGATSLACATALLDAGARVVSVLTFARAVPELARTARIADALRGEPLS